MEAMNTSNSLISSHSLILSLILFTTLSQVVTSTTFTLVNRCDFTIWPATLSSSGSPPLDSTGFQLTSGDTHTFQNVPPGWSGRIWARTGCNFNNLQQQGSCATGDCNTGQIQCNGATAIPPATLAEFTLGGSSGSQSDYYDVSLVDGFNLPMVVDVTGSSSSAGGNCQSTGCVADLNRQCPDELRSTDGDGCKSACEAFGTDEYCCSGAYGSPDKCKPSVYSQMFKTACPRAYSYAFDDASSTFTCSGGEDYRITFCPSLTSQKSSRDLPVVETGIKGPVVSTGDGVGMSWLSNMFSSNAAGDSCSLPTAGIRFHWRLMLTVLTAAQLLLLQST